MIRVGLIFTTLSRKDAKKTKALWNSVLSVVELSKKTRMEPLKSSLLSVRFFLKIPQLTKLQPAQLLFIERVLQIVHFTRKFFQL